MKKALFLMVAAAVATVPISVNAAEQYAPVAGISAEMREISMEPVQPENPTVEEEIELLARLINAEVGNVKDDDCLYACGSVVLNRVKAKDFPDTIYGAIYQDKPTIQYACTVDGNIDKDPTDRSMEIAEDLLRNGTTIPEDVIYQAEFRQGSGIWKRYKNVVFSRR